MVIHPSIALIVPLLEQEALHCKDEPDPLWIAAALKQAGYSFAEILLAYDSLISEKVRKCVNHHHLILTHYLSQAPSISQQLCPDIYDGQAISIDRWVVLWLHGRKVSLFAVSFQCWRWIVVYLMGNLWMKKFPTINPSCVLLRMDEHKSYMIPLSNWRKISVVINITIYWFLSSDNSR